ncbi:hypothetical protein [Nonomuraea sp. SYSU D8015]|uniref:hypothetical protein n=1 Tax=Nonomuraea sp. SYSU D8015 TaxID=2593644 RepID=UPI0016606EE9|nr:hypothetical protein [Nonomuraea sp. SYSU D8015]
MATIVFDVSDLDLDEIQVIEAPTVLEAMQIVTAGRGGCGCTSGNSGPPRCRA